MIKLRKNKGITLIILIITVIVLLILTGVSIGIVVNGDLFGKSKNTVDKANSQMENTKNQEQEIKSVWEQVPGKIIKSGTSLNSTIKFEYVTSDITRSSFRINVRGTNDEGEILTYTLIMEDKEAYIDGSIASSAETSKTGEEVYWDITGLSQDTEYKFEIIAEDSASSISLKGSEKTLKNNKPELKKVEVSNITATTATITAIGTDEDGDELTYILEINNNQVDTNKTGIFKVENLSPETEYSYTVIVKDLTDKASKTVTFKTTVENNPPVITSTKASNIKTKSATVTVTATDADGDTLSYTLVVTNNGTYTSSDGKFNVKNLTRGKKYTYTAYVSDGKATASKGDSFTTLSNTAPTLSVSVSGETESSVTITAYGKDEDGDTLNYTLTINGNTYGPNTTKSWTITGLSENTSYPYKVSVTDGYVEVTKEGTATTTEYDDGIMCDTCGDTGCITAAWKCTHPECSGTGKVDCTGESIDLGRSDYRCPVCVANGSDSTYTREWYRCSMCGSDWDICQSCGWTTGITHSQVQCPTEDCHNGVWACSGVFGCPDCSGRVLQCFRYRKYGNKWTSFRTLYFLAETLILTR